jgi:transposase-like protein
MSYRPAGYRTTGIGKARLFRCLSCRRRFVQVSAFLGMRHKPEIIVRCIDLYATGVSLRAISQHIFRNDGIKLSHTAIYKWIRKFWKLIEPYVLGFKINADNGSLHADEMMVQLNGEWVWLWNVISREHRFLLAQRMSRARGIPEGKALFKEARRKLDGLPMKITTDAMGAYPKAISGAFSTVSYPKVEHYVAPAITHCRQNNLIERYHNTVRARIKTMRGFKRIHSASEIMGLFSTFYNYSRPHMALNGMTPSESAGIGRKNIRELIEEAHEYDWSKRCQAGS